MSNKIMVYKCGQAIKKLRQDAGMTPSEFGAKIFPFASNRSQRTIIYQIEGDKRGVSLKTASDIDILLNSNLVSEIKRNLHEVYKK